MLFQETLISFMRNASWALKLDVAMGMSGEGAKPCSPPVIRARHANGAGVDRHRGYSGARPAPRPLPRSLPVQPKATVPTAARLTA